MIDTQIAPGIKVILTLPQKNPRLRAGPSSWIEYTVILGSGYREIRGVASSCHMTAGASGFRFVHEPKTSAHKPSRMVLRIEQTLK